MKFFDKKEYVTLVCYFLLIICAAFALSYPLAFRTASGESLFVNDRSYETLLVAQNPSLLFHPLQSNPYLSGPLVEPIPFSVANYLYAGLLACLPAWALPAIISFVLLTLLWLTLNTFSIPLSGRFIATCMFAFSPLFVTTQLSLGPVAFLFITTLLLVYALRSHWYPVICAIIAGICGLFGIDALLPLTIILVFSAPRSGHAPIDKQKQSALVGASLGFIVWMMLAALTHTSFTTLFAPHVLNSLFVDFGAQSGQTLLFVILAAIGAANIWKKELRWYFVSALSIFIWSLFFPNVALITTAILAYFAGSAFTKIWYSKWSYNSLKIIVLSSILLAVLVSYFIFGNQLITSSPNTQSLNAYDFISKNTPQDAVIFTTHYEAAMVSFFTQRSVVSTSDPLSANFAPRRLETQKILFAKTLPQVLTELRLLNVTHILIDPQLQFGDQWREDQGGLALLLRNKRAFTVVYNIDYLLYKVNYDSH